MIEAGEIVQGVDRNDQIERAVGERKAFGVAELQPILDLFLGVGQGVFGDVKAGNLKAGHDLRKIVKKKAFAAADVEDAFARLAIAIMLGQVLGDLAPAAVITIAAVAGLPAAVPVIEPPLAGQACGLGLGKLIDPARDSRVGSSCARN